MPIKQTIKQFCSRTIYEREQHGIERDLVSTSCSHRSHCSHELSSSENKKLLKFVTKSCDGLIGVEPSKVINELLSFEDKLEILRGELSEEAMSMFVEMWKEKK